MPVASVLQVGQRLAPVRADECIARSGASDISAAQQRMLHAVGDAQNAGFDVGEELSVSYTDHGGTVAEQAACQAQAEKMATEIWSRAPFCAPWARKHQTGRLRPIHRTAV